jgi:hypothetical protein
MTSLPDSAEFAPNRDPAGRGRKGLGIGFWAMMAFAAACLMAALAVAIVFGVFGSHTAPPPAPVPSPPVAAAPSPAAPAPATPTRADGPVADLPAPVELAALEGRVRRLESGQARGLDAAAGALAAAALSDAAAGPHPFINDLAAVERLMPGSPHVQALAPLAAQGAPTRTALAGELADIASGLSVAARTPPKNAGYMAQLGYAFSRVVSIRRVDASGSGPDAVLARAQKAAGDCDLEAAVALLDTLPPGARQALAGWRERAVRRIDIDSHIAALRALALADLASVAGGLS